jgi:hypothetical protein
MDLKAKTAARLKRKLNLSEGVTFALFDAGLIDDRTARRFLVKDDFEEASPVRGQKEETTEEIARTYCVSFETARNYIAGRHK